MTTTIILLGITGDLASRKILPAISQLSNKTHQPINLIGYSRSKPDEEKISSIIEQHGGEVEISFQQGNYDDSDKLASLFDKYTSEENNTIVYLAIPPKAFIPFLKNTCPLHPENIDIVIEKPFGVNKEQAEELIATAKSCSLTKSIHFFDHYMFKSSTYLSINQAKELTSLANIKPYSLTVRAVEALGVNGRQGYYNTVGAFKDMWQHLQSLGNHYARTFGVDLDWNNLVVNSKTLGQYETYTKELGEDSDTDTYFKIEGTLDGVHVVFESGKQVGYKDTSITAVYENGTTLKWNVDPVRYLEVTSGLRKIHEIMFEDEHTLDHTRLFMNLLEGDVSRFIDYDQILTTWNAFEKIEQFPINNFITYANDTLPE